MGIELPKDIQDMAIPAHMDARGTLSSIVGAFDDADIRKVEREAAKLEQLEDYNISTMTADKAEGTGRIANAASAIAQREEIARQQEKDNRDRTDTMILLNALSDLHDARNNAIEELQEIRENRAAVDELRALYEDGKLDPDNEEHQKLMKKAGITREDLMRDPTGAFDRQAKFWDEQERNKIREIEDIDRDIAKVEQILDATPEEQKTLLVSAEEVTADAAITSNQIEQNIVTQVLKEKAYSEEGISLQENAARGNMFSSGGFGSAPDETSAVTNSFASTLDFGEPPAMLNLSADFEVAANEQPLSQDMPILDLSSEFKFQ